MGSPVLRGAEVIILATSGGSAADDTPSEVSAAVATGATKKTQRVQRQSCTVTATVTEASENRKSPKLVSVVETEVTGNTESLGRVLLCHGRS